MPDLVINSLRGGVNNSDSPMALPDDQATAMTNIEIVESMLGERRLGTSAITLPAFLSGKDRVPFVYRHLPTSDETAAELWALAVTGTTTASLGRKTTAWQSEVTISDTATLTGFSQYRWQAVSVHGKLFFAYDSNVDRLHVWDGTSMRRVGLDNPAAAPTAADVGAGGSISGVRYYRVRFVKQVSGTTVVRSEPSSALTHTPAGTPTSVTVTRPALISESETHWELEASTDNANFYRIATTATGTSTYSDTANSYTNGTLSEDTGDYELIGSARYLSVDDDRLIWAGNWESDTTAARVGWTPVYGADGVGNDERFETDTDPFKDLDTYSGGGITGLSEPVLGGIWAFKLSAVYKLTRTGLRANAYDSDKYTDAVGAVHGSVVTGVDETGQPCVYFLDAEQGPCRIGLGGIKRCGDDIRTTWKDLNIDATKVIASALYYPLKKQVIWCIATGSSNIPDTAIVLHTDKSRTFADGIRKGWTLWNGNRAKALSMCLFADNIEDNAARSLTLVPFIGLEGLSLIHRCDTGTTDNAVAYTATTTSKPYWFKTIMNNFAVMRARLIAKATASAQVTVKCIKNFDTTAETTATVSDVSLAAAATETDVIKDLDNLIGADMTVAQFQFTDPTTVSAQWRVDHFSVREEIGQSS